MIITGIGSRPKGIPNEVIPFLLEIVADIGTVAAKNGWILRSGGADGMDSMFEDAWGVEKEIYIPWEGFRHHYSGSNGSIYVEDFLTLNLAASIASKIHPAWKKLDATAKAFHTRNVFQVRGEDLSVPSDMCIFYARTTPGGEVEGGTRTAVELCKQYGIPTYNLRMTEDVIKLKDFLDEWR